MCLFIHREYWLPLVTQDLRSWDSVSSFYSMPGMADNIKFILWSLLLCRCSSLCFGSDQDVQCLKDVLQSVADPNGILKATWTFFDNASDGFICQFTGVECWNPGENRVLALRLFNLGLEGQFPRGLLNCTCLSALDLSGNKFSGPIPSDVARLVPFLTSLDLSHNSFSGEIPVNISNMTYLNTLMLKHNQLSGQIPEKFQLIARLSTFNVADNLLSGPIPHALGSKFPAYNFAGNPELCGDPLDSCRSSSNDEFSVWMIGAAVGFIVGFVVAFYFPHWFVFSRRLQPYIVRIC